MNAAESTIVLTLGRETQLRLVTQARAVITAAPLVQPVAIGGLPMSVRLTSAGDLGWVADGTGYRYAPKDSRGFPWPRIPGEWIEISNRAVALDPRHDGRDVAWDSAILNWYPPGAKLGPHRDKSEHDRTRPIVTISLGFAARWAVEVERRGADEQGREVIGWEWTRARLPSGGVTVLAGELRNAVHAIDGLILPEDDSQGDLFGAPEHSPIVDAAGIVVPGRLSITLREAGRRNR
jgi:alkylated DNA repair protein (DNA oxidative demethylase)